MLKLGNSNLSTDRREVAKRLLVAGLSCLGLGVFMHLVMPIACCLVLVGGKYNIKIVINKNQQKGFALVI